jgi:dipeptidyl-peptidase-3
MKGKLFVKIMMIVGMQAVFAGCVEKKADFKYLLDEFADIKVMRYTIPGWEELSLQQKEYAYHLSEAAKWGRDIFWDQNCRYNLAIRHTVENILENYKGERDTKEFDDFTIYAKRLFFANGIHHHYAEEKFLPECSQEYFKYLMEAVSDGAKCAELLPVIYYPSILRQRRSTADEGDIVLLSASNFYEGVTRAEVEQYYESIADKTTETPVAYGLNTKVVKDDGKVKEITWHLNGMYGPAIAKICDELSKAAACAENDIQKRALGLLIKYYETGDLKIWDEFNIEWLKDTIGTVDFINGFIEDYNDPLGRKGSWEGYVNIKDHKASERSNILSANAQWFEDNSPMDPRFKKTKCKGVSAKVVNAVCMAGDAYPATPIGINLPNSDWIRKMYGSKSVTITNITGAYNYAAQESPTSTLDEFAWDEEEKDLYRKWGAHADEIHTDLHECLGHGSGQLLPGVSGTALGEYSSVIEETRADLFGLYYIADPKMVELGLMPDKDAYKAGYSNYIRNGIMVQFSRVELNRPNTQTHMQNRKLIAEWCYEKGAENNVIEKRVRDGKTYFVINDYEALRSLFARMLAEIQRIKSEGDYEAGKHLVETYAVNIDPNLHKEVKERYESLNLKPYGGFINPDIVPVEKDGKIVDYEVIYNDDYLKQQLDYGKKYRTL